MQANIGRTAVQAVIFGNRDLKRHVPAEPQRAAEADHDAGIGKRRHIRFAIGRGMGIDLRRQAQMAEEPPGHAKVSEGNKTVAKVRKSARRLSGKRSQARTV